MWCYRAAAILLPAAETQREWVVLSGWLMDLNKDCQAANCLSEVGARLLDDLVLLK